MLVFMRVRVGMRMLVIVFGFVMKRVGIVLSRVLSLPVYQDVDFGGADPAPIYTSDLKRRAEVQCCNRLTKEFGRNSGIDQGAEKHVATDPGKAIEVGKAVLGPWSLVVSRRPPAQGRFVWFRQEEP